MKHARKAFALVVLGIGGGFAFAACGGTTSSTNTSTDAASPQDVSVVDVVVKDTFVPDVGSPDSATCDLSTDLTADIPDAALSDGGAQSTGLCLACANQKSTCQSDIQQCSLDCDCKNAVEQAITCIAKGGNELSCGSGLISLPQAAQTIGIGLLECVQTNCATECTPPQLADGGGTPTDAGDDASD